MQILVLPLLHDRVNLRVGHLQDPQVLGQIIAAVSTSCTAALEDEESRSVALVRRGEG